MFTNVQIFIAFLTVSIWLLTLLICLYSLAKLCNFSCLKRLESLPIHPTEDVWLPVCSNNKLDDPVMYNENMQAVKEYNDITITGLVEDDKEIYSPDYEFPTQRNKNESVEYPLHEPDVLKIKLKELNFDFKPMDIDLILRASLVSSNKRK